MNENGLPKTLYEDLAWSIIDRITWDEDPVV